jgi:hypothetical protein
MTRFFNHLDSFLDSWDLERTRTTIGYVLDASSRSKTHGKSLHERHCLFFRIELAAYRGVPSTVTANFPGLERDSETCG